MLVAPVKDLDVQVELAMLGERMPEMLGQLDGKRPDSVARVPDFINEVRAARQIDHGAGQRLVHRRVSRAVALYAFFVAERFGERPAQTDRRVLDRMAVINLQIALARDFEVEKPVAREQVEHVVEERNAGRDCAFSLPVEVELEMDVSLFGRALDFSLTRHKKKSPSKRRSICRSLQARRR